MTDSTTRSETEWLLWEQFRDRSMQLLDSADVDAEHRERIKNLIDACRTNFWCREAACMLLALARRGIVV